MWTDVTHLKVDCGMLQMDGIKPKAIVEITGYS